MLHRAKMKLGKNFGKMIHWENEIGQNCRLGKMIYWAKWKWAKCLESTKMQAEPRGYYIYNQIWLKLSKLIFSEWVSVCWENLSWHSYFYKNFDRSDFCCIFNNYDELSTSALLNSNLTYMAEIRIWRICTLHKYMLHTMVIYTS